MKKSIILIALFILGMQSIYPNDRIEISLLTCSSGKETFSAWGHSAIRIVDKDAGIDVVYNFGLFDFDTPNFYGKFVKGKLKYKLGVHHSQNFYNSYFEENRQIIEQKLNLSEESQVRIISRLQYLYRPENRYYYYSFVGKNCTTELRDLILENAETDFQNKNTNKTHREQLNEFLQGRLWLKFSMSLIMGYKVDKEIDLFQSMFLPDYLCNEIRNIKVNNKNIVESEQIFNQVYNPYNSYPLLANPLLIFSLVLVLIIIINSKYIQNTILIITGITGLTIFLVGLFTEHPELKYNLNYLWINPLYIVVLILELLKKNNIRFYLTIFIQVLSIIMLIVWVFNIQDFDNAFLPLFFILSVINFRIIKQNLTKLDKPKKDIK